MVVTSMMPTTGVTLPFFSSGGTATVFLLIEIGMVLNVEKEKPFPEGAGAEGGKTGMREHTKVIHIGDRVIGGGNPVLIQSMTNTKTEDVQATVAQIQALAAAGCDIIRCAVPTMEAAKALAEIKKQITIPLVADIHFDYRLAIAAMENGADKIRINPGNIGSRDRVQAVVDVAKERRIPIRVGVNSGSLEKELVEKYHGVTAEGIVESAMDKVHLIEDMGYDQLVISIKSSDVMMCAKAHELIADRTDYPLPCGHYGGRHPVFREYQVGGGTGHHSLSGNRRHHPRLPDRGSAGGGALRQAHPEDAGAS